MSMMKLWKLHPYIFQTWLMLAIWYWSGSGVKLRLGPNCTDVLWLLINLWSTASFVSLSSGWRHQSLLTSTTIDPLMNHTKLQVKRTHNHKSHWLYLEIASFLFGTMEIAKLEWTYDESLFVPKIWITFFGPVKNVYYKQSVILHGTNP